jgi:phosphatidylglycerophosphatase A
VNTSTGVRANSRFMFAHPAHLIAQGFGSGLSGVIPGTFGTLLGWLSFNVLSARWPQVFTPIGWSLIILAAFGIGIWACEKTGRDLGAADHGSMVWDEVVAIWIVMLLVTPSSLQTQFGAFVCFRLFDMAKPAPISYFDRRFKGGFGVMLDDVVAAFFTLLVIAIWRTI